MLTRDHDYPQNKAHKKAAEHTYLRADGCEAGGTIRLYGLEVKESGTALNKFEGVSWGRGRGASQALIDEGRSADQTL